MSGEAIKPGYKRTEVGVIPEEWRAVELNTVCTMKSGEGITAERIDDFSAYPCYGGNGLRGYTSRYTHDGKFALVGRQGALCGNVNAVQGKFYASEHAVVVTPKVGIDITFLTYVLSEMRLNRYTESSAQPGLSVSKVLTLRLSVPSNEVEQRAIADALSDVDALLAKIDHLIAKKRDLKQAAMQQLLTGQTRLPGFSGDWEVKRLGDVAVLKNGYTFKSESYTELGKYKVVTIANVQDGWMRLDGCNSINSLPIDLQPHQKLEIGDLLLSMTGNVGRVCQVAEGNCLLNQRVGKIVAQNINFDFLHAIISGVAFQKSMTDVAKGGAQPNLSASDILNYPVNMPVDENEQKAIAAVIFDIKSELTTLQARRDKTRALKQGMMQELLTGRIRLI